MKLFTRNQRVLAYRKLKKENKKPGNTIQSKIKYKMAWDRNPLLSTFADKLATRTYIEKRIGQKYLVPILGVFDRANQIDFDSLPLQFVLKVNHGSGGIIVVSDKADKSNRFPQGLPVGWLRFEIHPNTFSAHDASKILDNWLELNYEWWPGKEPEWGYKDVAPKIFIEEFLNSQTADALFEFKVFVVNGRVQIIQVSHGNLHDGKSFAYYDRDWKFIPVIFNEGGTPHKCLEEQSPPKFLSDLISLSEILMRGVDFARVDFLDDGGILRIGEITNYPTAGNFDFVPSSFSELLGVDWHPKYSQRGK